MIVGIEDQAWKRVVRSVKWTERRETTAGGRVPLGLGSGSPVWVRISGPVTPSGADAPGPLYAAVFVVWDNAAGGWVVADAPNDCLAREANGGDLARGRVYDGSVTHQYDDGSVLVQIGCCDVDVSGSGSGDDIDGDGTADRRAVYDIERVECVDGSLEVYKKTVYQYLGSGLLSAGSTWTFDRYEGCCECASGGEGGDHPNTTPCEVELELAASGLLCEASVDGVMSLVDGGYEKSAGGGIEGGTGSDKGWGCRVTCNANGTFNVEPIPGTFYSAPPATYNISPISTSPLHFQLVYTCDDADCPECPVEVTLDFTEV